jgi:hypothetical protein
MSYLKLGKVYAGKKTVVNLGHILKAVEAALDRDTDIYLDSMV